MLKGKYYSVSFKLLKLPTYRISVGEALKQYIYEVQWPMIWLAGCMPFNHLDRYSVF